MVVSKEKVLFNTDSGCRYHCGRRRQCSVLQISPGAGGCNSQLLWMDTHVSGGSCIIHVVAD